METQSSHARTHTHRRDILFRIIFFVLFCATRHHKKLENENFFKRAFDVPHRCVCVCVQMSRTSSVTSNRVESLNCKMCCVTLISCLRSFEFAHEKMREKRKTNDVVDERDDGRNTHTAHDISLFPFVRPCSLCVGCVSSEFIARMEKPRKYLLCCDIFCGKCVAATTTEWKNGQIRCVGVVMVVLVPLLPANTAINDKREFSRSVK